MCKDGSCNGNGAWFNANIDYVVGPSCTGFGPCARAQIGSADSSCTTFKSCASAKLSGVDLIDSCNEFSACDEANDVGAFDELIDCCNDEFGQCRDKEGLDIVNAGCVSYMCI